MPRISSRLPLRAFASFLLTALLMILEPTGAFADAELQTKIDVAGRQRMLSQRMMRTMCNVEIGVDTMANKKTLLTSEFLFRTSLQALKEGGGPSKFTPETDPHSLTLITRIEEVWEEFRSGIDAFNAGRLKGYEDFAAMSELSLDLLKVSNALVQRLETRYQAQATQSDPALGKMINISGRQRMLIQKAGKEVCLLHMADGTPEAERQIEHMQQTLTLFEDSAFGLTFSSPTLGLPPPPTEDIAVDNFQHWQEWSNLVTLFEASQSSRLDPHELHEISISVEFFLKALNETVGRYAAL
ncbi:type IV pili methyl-accepting chemotaxis transducer N-terminal domain-containing protein [Celeribacter sp. ULVN23_4]